MSEFDGWQNAQRVCVLGAGTMGSGIAAHLANLGFDVTLLDLTPESVHVAFDRAKSSRPPQFFVPETAESIRLGSIRDNLSWVREADWVCEAIVEKLNAKQDLFSQIEPLLKPDAMISTNTSGLQIGLLSEGRSDSFRRRFLGTHFFNPPRYLKLLELIPTEETEPEAVEAMTKFLEDRVARRVVPAKDTPGFIANRFGMWAMFHAIHTAEKLHLSAEQVDAITGPFIGRPRSASFRLNDIVGLDIMADIGANLVQRCPDDPFVASNFRIPKSMGMLMEKGWIGEKAGQGYYRREGKELMVYDLETLAYRERREVSFPALESLGKLPTGERIRQALDLRDEAGEFLREHLLPVLRYANHLKDEISHNVEDFDRVMKWGFAWELGPFETIDAIGPDRLGITDGAFYEGPTMRAFEGGFVPKRIEPQYAVLTDFKPVEEGDGYRIRDLGDGIEALCLTTKMGTINPELVESLHNLLDSGRLDRFVLTSEAKWFSAGFDLRFFLERIEATDWEGIDRALDRLQSLTQKLGQTRSVAAIFGYCLGAGQELAMGCSAAAANVDAQIGLPEAKVGLLPGGAGAAIMRLRAQFGGAKRIAEVAHQLASGATCANAVEALKKGYLRETDHVAFHPDRLLFEARERAKTVEPRPLPTWLRPEGPIAGMIDRLLSESVQRGDFTDHDALIGLSIKNVFAKAVSLEDALAKERSEFLELCRNALSVTRIRHMLDNGKPLRN